MWKFDGTSWTWVAGSNLTDQIGDYGTKEVAAASNYPGARSAPVVWADTASKIVWLIGGFGIGVNEDSGNIS